MSNHSKTKTKSKVIASIENPFLIGSKCILFLSLGKLFLSVLFSFKFVKAFIDSLQLVASPECLGRVQVVFWLWHLCLTLTPTQLNTSDSSSTLPSASFLHFLIVRSLSVRSVTRDVLSRQNLKWSGNQLNRPQKSGLGNKVAVSKGPSTYKNLLTLIRARS